MSIPLRSEAEIQKWLVTFLADLLEVPAEKVDVGIPFNRYGLDSSAAVGVTDSLATWLGRDLDPTLLYDFPNVQALSKHLASDAGRAA
jgi:acyl carrier protein